MGDSFCSFTKPASRCACSFISAASTIQTILPYSQTPILQQLNALPCSRRKSRGITSISKWTGEGVKFQTQIHELESELSRAK
jgi:hypothetical protein